MSPTRALLPQDFLVAYSDVLPGLRRFNTQGQLTTGIKASINTLASPVLAPGWVLQLAQLQLAVPQVCWLRWFGTWIGTCGSCHRCV
jgi:nephrocystin-4